MRTVADLRNYIDTLVGYDVVTSILPAAQNRTNPLTIYLKHDITNEQKKMISSKLPLGCQPIYEVEPPL